MAEKTTEEKILDAALKEFAEHGLDGARVDRIAKKANINKAMIYYHYKGKEALYETVLSSVYNEISENVLKNIPENISPDEQYKTIISSFIDFITSIDQDFIRMMLRELSSGGTYIKKIGLPQLFIPALNTIQSIFDRGISDGTFKEINPAYTFIQTFGSMVFFNAIRLTLKDTDPGKILFNENHIEEFKKNLITVSMTGILNHNKEK